MPEKKDVLGEEINISFSNIFNLIPDPAVVVDETGKFLEVNDAVVKQTGFFKKELLGKNFFKTNIVTFKSKSIMIKNLAMRMIGKKVKPYVVETVTKKGKRIYYEVNAMRIKYKDDVADFVIFRDINKRVIVEKELTESEEKFRKITESTNDLIYEWFIDSNQLIWYGDIDKLLGFKKNEFPRTLKAWVSRIHPDDRKKIGEEIKKQREVGGLSDSIYRIKKKDGSWAYWNDRGINMLDSNDKPYKMIGACIDITADKEAEEKIKEQNEIINNSPIVVFLWQNKPNWPVEFVSDNVKHLFGYSRNDFTSGKIKFSKVIHKDDLKRVSEEVSKFSKNKTVKEYNQIYRIVTKDKKVKWIDDRTVIRRNEKGKITHYQGIVFDITEKKEAEERYKKLSEASSEIIVFHKKGIIKCVSEKVKELLGYSGKELIGKNLLSLVPKEEHKKIFSAIKSAQDLKYETKIIKKDNSVIDVEVYSSVLDGQRFATIRDITNRKKSEINLKESEQKYKSVVEHSSNLFYIHDKNHKLIYLSPICKQFLGYTPKELEIKWTKLASDNPINKEGIKLTNKAINTGKKQDPYLLELIKKNGKRIIVEVNESPMKDDNGKVIAMTGSLRDITEELNAKKELQKARDHLEEEVGNRTIELEESNDNFNSLLENSINGVVVLDLDKKVKYMNPVAKTFFGNKKKLFEDFDFKKYSFFDDFEVNNKKLHAKLELKVTHTRWEKKDSYLVIIRDVTKEKLAEEKIKEEFEKLRELDILKSNFLLTTSHELKSPMTPIKAQIQLLMKGYMGKISSKQTNSLNVILKNLNRLHNLVEDILDLSKMKAGKQKFHMSKTDLVEVVKDTIGMMIPIANKKKLKIRTIIKEVPKVRVDKERLSQVIYNLIDNAIKYTKKGNLTVSMFKEKNDIVFKVKDTGLGLNQEEVNKIFEVFYRVSNPFNRQVGGTGLGLDICKHIIEYHGGKIWVESKKDRGSTFIFTLPISKKRKRKKVTKKTTKKKVAKIKIARKIKKSSKKIKKKAAPKKKAVKKKVVKKKN